MRPLYAAAAAAVAAIALADHNLAATLRASPMRDPSEVCSTLLGSGSSGGTIKSNANVHGNNQSLFFGPLGAACRRLSTMFAQFQLPAKLSAG